MHAHNFCKCWPSCVAGDCLVQLVQMSKLDNCESKAYSQSSVRSIPEKEHVSQLVLHHLETSKKLDGINCSKADNSMNSSLWQSCETAQSVAAGLTDQAVPDAPAFSLTLKAVRAKAFPRSPRIAVRSCDVGIHSLAAGWLRLQPPTLKLRQISTV